MSMPPGSQGPPPPPIPPPSGPQPGPQYPYPSAPQQPKSDVSRIIIIILIIVGVLALLCVGGCFVCMAIAKQGVGEAQKQMDADVKRLEAEWQKAPEGSPEKATLETQLKAARDGAEAMDALRSGDLQKLEKLGTPPPVPPGATVPGKPSTEGQ